MPESFAERIRGDIVRIRVDIDVTGEQLLAALEAVKAEHTSSEVLALPYYFNTEHWLLGYRCGGTNVVFVPGGIAGGFTFPVTEIRSGYTIYNSHWKGEKDVQHTPEAHQWIIGRTKEFAEEFHTALMGLLLDYFAKR